MTQPTPEPTQIPSPEPTPEPTPEPQLPPSGHGDSSERLDRLEGLVSGLIDAVNKLIPSDDKPVRKPWTHYGSKD